MSKKVFISYSHKDEVYKEALDEHLAMLKRNNIIDAWHDRKIVPGQDWSKEISTQLDQSELILFLISPSFLGSDYCFKLEMNRAIEMHSAGEAQIIPIVVRHCDWAECDLAQFQAVPKDAKPIASWDDQDEAWLDAIKGIKSHLAHFKPVRQPAPANKKIKFEISDATLSWIEDTEIALTHRKVDKVNLSDIYVSLDMDNEELVRSKDIAIISSDVIFTRAGRYLVFGEEQQGKSTLLKHAFKQLLKAETVPVYLNAREINQSDIAKSLTAALKAQYVNLELDQFYAMSNRALLIDDFNEIGLNAKYRETFLAAVNSVFTQVVVTCHSAFSYVAPEVRELSEYTKYELKDLGNAKRFEIAEKWVSLGVEESITEHNLYEQCDELKARLDTIIRKNIVPPKPIYILMLLQMFEAYAQQNLELSSHGHCYQQLIYQAFDHAKIPKNEIDRYLKESLIKS